MKTLKRLISYVVAIVALTTLVSCGSSISDCKRANNLAQIGINSYCITDPTCCRCQCINGSLTDCICKDRSKYFYNCENDQLEIKRCISDESLCIDNWKIFTGIYCGW